MNERELLEGISKKLDVVAEDVRTNSYRIDRIEAGIDNLDKATSARFDRIDRGVEVLADKLNLMSKQFSAVTSKVIESDQRLNHVEARLAALEGEIH
ncbi:MAG: hypothetical protein ACT4O9_05180 [Blastocatellia bacterium]